MILKSSFEKGKIEAGCDEAGRGCLAGPVTAAAVILPDDFYCPTLDDSKKLSEHKRNELRKIIESEALSIGISFIDNITIDKKNILQSSIIAMHNALDQLKIKPELILIDGNYFKNYNQIPHKCIVKGDAKFASIAAASIIAKTYRDEMMLQLHEEYPEYDWKKNKGYPTKHHRNAVLKYGYSPLHRLSFKVTTPNVKLLELPF